MPPNFENKARDLTAGRWLNLQTSNLKMQSSAGFHSNKRVVRVIFFPGQLGGWFYKTLVNEKGPKNAVKNGVEGFNIQKSNYT